MVHRRSIDGEATAFGNHGALFGNAMTWWDHPTGSVWSQPTGTAIMGPLAGETLDLLPSTLTTWVAWKAAHPLTLALDVNGWETRFRLEKMAIVVDLGLEAVAYPTLPLRDVGVVNDVVADIPIAVVIDPTDPQRWAVFSRVLDGATVDFAFVDEVLTDVVTGSTFDPFIGVGRTGALGDQQLDKLGAFTVFPRDFPTFYPEGTIWGP